MRKQMLGNLGIKVFGVAVLCFLVGTVAAQEPPVPDQPDAPGKTVESSIEEPSDGGSEKVNSDKSTEEKKGNSVTRAHAEEKTEADDEKKNKSDKKGTKKERDSGDDSKEVPNVLWITAEDMSPTLGCYGDEYATTPNIDAFAKESTRYTHAFATAPVCSPSRSCLIHGCIATSSGTHSMRSLLPIPAEMNGFPKLLRDLGYYTTNNEKTDYNTVSATRITLKSWDKSSGESTWEERPSDAPFFSVMNLMVSHQSRTMVWPYEQFESEVQTQLDKDQWHDPKSAPVPPYYPDTPVVRKTIARFYDCVSVMDQQVGKILSDLDEQGLADDTIVFFYSDHGSGMPRHKRALYDSGMHVPLMVRIPEKFADWRPTKPGESTDRLVCFEDFGPTVMSLTGIEELPKYMRGKPFLGPLDTKKRDYVFGHRDRVDEIRDMARSVRNKDFLYIRNYMPHLGWNQQNSWCDQGEIREEFYALAESGKMSPAQRQYLGGSRPLEELYDCANDPLNLNNLADSKEHADTKRELMEKLDRHLKESVDLGFLPEADIWKLCDQVPPMNWAVENQEFITTAREAAQHVGSNDLKVIRKLLFSENRSARYWGCLACVAADSINDEIKYDLGELLEDPSITVQIEAANALVRHGETHLAFPKFRQILKNVDATVLLHAARTIELIGDPKLRKPMQTLFDDFETAPGDMAWFIRFSTTGYLSRLGSEEK